MQALLVGCGAMARGWADAVNHNALIKHRVNICGLVDPDTDRRSAFAKSHGHETLPVFDDLGSALIASTPDIIFDVTPPDIRFDIVSTGLAAGAHVLSEKPMANSMQEARALAAKARDSNRVFAVTQNRRYKPGARRIRAFLGEDGLGTITGIHADFFLGPHFGGFREDMENVLLLDMAIHHFDAARFMTGQNAKSVHCLETNPVGSWYAHGASAFATFEMSKGAIFTYRGSWCAEGAPTSWDASWRITGSKGSLTWDGEAAIDGRVATGSPAFFRETKEIEVPDPRTDAATQEHASVISAFLDAIETGKAPETDSSDNIHSMAMVFGAIESARTGLPQTIKQDFS